MHQRIHFQIIIKVEFELTEAVARPAAQPPLKEAELICNRLGKSRFVVVFRTSQASIINRYHLALEKTGTIFNRIPISC